MPHEPMVRAWLRRARAAPEEVDDLVQECYCRFAALDRFGHIERPGFYFVAMARNLLIRSRRRAKIVSFERIAGIDEIALDDAPSPERTAAGRLAFERLRAMLAELPDRCRRILVMRKFDGLSQREIALTLGVTESIVENDVQLGLRRLRAAWQEQAGMGEDDDLGMEGRRA